MPCCRIEFHAPVCGVLQTKVEKNTKQVQARKAKGAKQSTEDDEGAAEADKPKRWSDYSVRLLLDPADVCSHCQAVGVQVM